MRFPSTVCLRLALLGAGLTVPAVSFAASSSPTEGVEDHDIVVPEDKLATGVSYTFIREGDPKAPFTLVEDGEEDNPVKIRSVKSAPSGLTVTFSGSTFTLKGTAGGTITFETQFRDIAVSVGVDKAPICDSDFGRVVGLGQREVLVDAADLCLDPEGGKMEVTGIKATDGSTAKVTYNDDGTATVSRPSTGEGEVELLYGVVDNGCSIGTGTFTIVDRDWDPFYRIASGGTTTIDTSVLEAEVSTKEDPLKAVDITLVDPDEQLESNCCDSIFTITDRDWDPIYGFSPVIEGEFVDSEDNPIYATWEFEYNEVATCTEGSAEAKSLSKTVTLSVTDACTDPEGDTLTVEGVTVDGKAAEYSYDLKTGDLVVYLPVAKKAGEVAKIQARVGNNGGKRGYDPIKEGTFTITFRDDF